MTAEQGIELTTRVQAFLEQQPGYDRYASERLEVVDDGDPYLGVIFGIDMMKGLCGFGKSVDEAYKAFMRNWKELHGFEWIEKNKSS